MISKSMKVYFLAVSKGYLLYTIFCVSEEMIRLRLHQVHDDHHAVYLYATSVVIDCYGLLNL